MPVLCLQLQPRRATGLSVQLITVLMARVAAASEVQGFSFERGSDHGPYINYLFASRAPSRVWRGIQQRVLKHRRLGPRVRRASIVTCEGSRGWKNYLLLHHFDSAKHLDALPGV